MKIAAIDIGGTHARFALAEIAGSRVVELAAPVTLRTADHPSLQAAWQASGLASARPAAASLSIAAPANAELIRFTNNPWSFRPATLADEIGVSQVRVINDFAAVSHAVAQVDETWLEHLGGPEAPLPETGTISVIGPGTGLGVGNLWRGERACRVQPTEGGHLDFAPLDAFEDALLARLRLRHGRVSTERVVSGPGLAAICETLAALEGSEFTPRPDAELWRDGLSGEDRLASAAIDRFCLSLGSVAGDIALAQGGTGVVIAGGLGLRIRHRLRQSGFSERFCAKGRFAALMAAIPVKLITHPEPGLLGAAAAFAASSA